MENKKLYSRKTTDNFQETEITKIRLKRDINRAVRKATRRKSKRNKIIIIAVFAVIYAVFSLIISLNENFWKNENIPKWHELYEAAGLSSSANTDIKSDVAVHFIDVEQGDCALIVAGDYTVLIDAGEVSEKSKVITYIRSLEIERLDMVIASHPHSDHIGSLSAVIDEYGTDILVMPEETEDMTPVTSSYEKMIDSADECGAEIRFAEIGESLKLSEGCTIDILAPVADYDDHNNYSIVCRLNYGETSFLFTGDIENKAERDIVDSGADISADVIKIAHHGSNTSSLKVFMQNVDPDYAVISVGAPNDYGHPHSETLKLLQLLGIELYRTDYHGDIVMFSDGKDITVVTEKKEVENAYY